MTKNGIAPAVFTTHPIAEESETNGTKEFNRDEQGRFLAGHSVGGRPPGSRNKLSENFIEDFHGAWQEHGKAALEKMATEEPVKFVQAAVQLMPRDVLVDARVAGLTVIRMSDEDLAL